jgi:hypothetical protein
MPWVGFEPTIPASEWAKTVHVLDRSAIVTGTSILLCVKHNSFLWFILKVILFKEVYQIFWILWEILMKNEAISLRNFFLHELSCVIFIHFDVFRGPHYTGA